MAKRLDNTPSHLVAALATAGIGFCDCLGPLRPQNSLVAVCAALAHRLGLAVDAQETPRHRRFRFRWVSHWFVALASVRYPSMARLVQ